MTRLRTLIIATVTVAVAGLAFGAAASFGPPAIGEPLIGVSVQCAPYGSSFEVTASGFQPGTAVTISNPAGHYTGPPSMSGSIASVTASADASGAVRVKLRVHSASAAEARYYRAATIWADGPGKIDGQRSTVFTGVVVASKAACQQLDHPPKAKPKA